MLDQAFNQIEDLRANFARHHEILDKICERVDREFEAGEPVS